jgi:hypothetical protein
MFFFRLKFVLLLFVFALVVAAQDDPTDPTAGTDPTDPTAGGAGGGGAGAGAGAGTDPTDPTDPAAAGGGAGGGASVPAVSPGMSFIVSILHKIVSYIFRVF